MSNNKTMVAIEEIKLYNSLSQSIRALILGSDALMKAMNVGQHRLLEGVTSLTGLKKDVEETSTSPR